MNHLVACPKCNIKRNITVAPECPVCAASTTYSFEEAKYKYTIKCYGDGCENIIDGSKKKLMYCRECAAMRIKQSAKKYREKVKIWKQNVRSRKN